MGGETKNIDEIASIISDKIFTELKWKINKKYTDINWECCSDTHTNKTHPTDIVFNYLHPYSGVMQYIQTDLKSYAKDSISVTRTRNAVSSLALQVACAKQSTEWADMYRNNESKFDLHGMLFIYNNDEKYDTDLLEKCGSFAFRDFKLPSSSTLNIFSPRLIRFLMTVVENIKERRNIEEDESEESVLKAIPKRSECSFFYPDKHTQYPTEDINHPATLEMITSGMLLYSYTNKYLGIKVLNVYWDEEINSESFFIYLFEFIFNYQMLTTFDRIFVITPFSTKAGKHFTKAIKLYKSQYAVTENQQKRLEKIQYLYMDTVKTTIFPFQVTNGEVLRQLNMGEI